MTRSEIEPRPPAPRTDALTTTPHGGQSNMFDTLLQCLWPFMVKRAALCWMNTSLVISLAGYGSHTTLAYSSRDCTKLYVIVLSCCSGVPLILRERCLILYTLILSTTTHCYCCLTKLAIHWCMLPLILIPYYSSLFMSLSWGSVLNTLLKLRTNTSTWSLRSNTDISDHRGWQVVVSHRSILA